LGTIKQLVSRNQSYRHTNHIKSNQGYIESEQISAELEEKFFLAKEEACEACNKSQPNFQLVR
jgi:hypothetical protein